MKHVYLYDPIYHAILNLKTHIYTYYDQITTLFLVSFYFVYKITKDYLFFTRKVIDLLLLLLLLYIDS